jgi:acyl-CoA synthetase (AMP-forming)/AMP-acid ligase II
MVSKACRTCSSAAVQGSWQCARCGGSPRKPSAELARRALRREVNRTRTYGEELMAWVRMRPGAPPITAEGLREFCAGKLSHHKVQMRAEAVELLGLG